MKYNIKIVGLGGIGSSLANILSRFVNYDNDNTYVFHLVDGKEISFRKLERQEFESDCGNKADLKKMELERKFPNIRYESCPFYLNDRNISNIIEEGDIICLCVDNHKSRCMVSKFADALDDVVLISAGNDLIDGNAQLYVRQNGIKITPSLTDYHPEILNFTDKLPDELSCEELAYYTPQIYLANLKAAVLMAEIFRIYKLDKELISETYFNIDTTNVRSVSRKPKK